MTKSDHRLQIEVLLMSFRFLNSSKEKTSKKNYHKKWERESYFLDNR